MEQSMIGEPTLIWRHVSMSERMGLKTKRRELVGMCLFCTRMISVYSFYYFMGHGKHFCHQTAE
jgi:hypothetical protein